MAETSRQEEVLEQKKTTFKVVCSWCNKVMSEKEVAGEIPVISNSICPECSEGEVKKALRQIQEVKQNKENKE